MASVCGASLALMDAGVPVKSACAGIAMGLIKEGDDVAILTDILGLEDALGDMDFKIAGTREGVTSIQMDIKIEGLTHDILKTALEQAHKGRMHILDHMDQALAEPRSDLSQYAPRIVSIQINPSKIGDIIGPKGKTIRAIQEESGAKIDIDDSGLVKIAAVSGEAGARAREMVEAIVQEPEIGRIYEGPVKVERRVPSLPFSREVRRLEWLKRSLTVYRLAFGQPRQEDLLEYLQSLLGTETATKDLAELQIRLQP